jgi:hypothetical protein
VESSRAEQAATSAKLRLGAEKSTPKAPLSWMSTKPGARMSPPQSTGVLGGLP